MHVNFFLCAILTALGEGLFEIMCHPGYNGRTLESISSYNCQRQIELAILTDPLVIAVVRQPGIRRVSFAG